MNRASESLARVLFIIGVILGEVAQLGDQLLQEWEFLQRISSAGIIPYMSLGASLALEWNLCMFGGTCNPVGKLDDIYFE